MLIDFQNSFTADLAVNL